MLRRAALLVLLIGCRGSTAAQVDGPPGDPGDAAAPDADDGTDGMPVRRPCVAPSGTVLADGAFGRLDGLLVAIIPPGPRSVCNADNDHVHLQIAVGSGVYDIAVNVGSDVHSLTFDHSLFGAPWLEGWHTGADVFVDYGGLGIHSTTIPLSTPAALVGAITTDLAAANHVSIYATGYGPQGADLVHWNGNRRDGLIVSQPLSATAHMRAFSFTAQTF
jgi:hypothetical protein